MHNSISTLHYCPSTTILSPILAPNTISPPQTSHNTTHQMWTPYSTTFHVTTPYQNKYTMIVHQIYLYVCNLNYYYNTNTFIANNSIYTHLILALDWSRMLQSYGLCSRNLCLNFLFACISMRFLPYLAEKPSLLFLLFNSSYFMDSVSSN